MKIKNDFVSIRIGEKHYDFKNLIMDSYLERIIKRQLNETNYTKNYCDTALRYCLLKFDEPLEFEANSDIRNINFDLAIISVASFQQNIAPMQISVKTFYDVTSGYLYDYASRRTDVKISDYYGRKITAIGFNSGIGNDTGWANPWPVCAILDTSNYNLYLQENQDFVITRKDTISSDATFWASDSKIKGPLHLVPWGEKINNKEHYGVLYSVGFGYNKNKIYEEKIIGNEATAIQEKNRLQIEPLSNYKEIVKPIFLNRLLFAFNKLFPLKIDYKYIILKYKVWKLENNIPTDTGIYYLHSLPIEKYGEGNLIIKYERG